MHCSTESLWVRNEGPQKGPKITALSPFFCHPFFFLFPSFHFLLFPPSLINHFFLSSPPSILPVPLSFPPLAFFSSPFFLPCCLDDHRTACCQMRGWRRNSVKGRKEEGGKEGRRGKKMRNYCQSLLSLKKDLCCWTSLMFVIQTCHELYQFSLHTTAKYCSS